MKTKWLKYLIGFTIICVISGVFIQYVELIIMKMDISPEGGPDPFFSIFFITVPLLFLAGLSIPVGLIALVIKKIRFLGIFLLCGGGVFLTVTITMGIYNRNVRVEAFQKLGSRLAPLVDAIEKYASSPELVGSLLPNLYSYYLTVK